ncbi:arabinosyltransferase domain-containing protein [Geodermatophilus sp. SYSU D00965]
MDVVDLDRAGAVPGEEPAPRPARRLRGPVPLLLALLAVLCAVALPLAPVEMSVPTVSWPQDPQRPAATMLELTNQEPLALDVRFSCAAVAAAAATPEGVVVSTLVPGHPAAQTDGLLVTARDGTLRVLARGQELLAEPVRGGDCAYGVEASRAGLSVTRDGVRLASVPVADGPDTLPDVDVLATSVTRLPTDDDLRVQVTVDDQFNTTPTAVKGVLVAVLLLSAAGALVALWRRERGLPRPAPVDRGPSPGWPARVVDVLVVGTLLLWWFIAPLSDDDGYYAAMARNASAEGFVGNYYQILNQSFTPFTWFYRLLGWWQQVGTSPVLLRVPALLVGLGTWVLLRRFVTRPGGLPDEWAGRRAARLAVVVVLAATFLAWWLPYGMGVRPEAVVGLLALATMTAVAAALRTGRLLPLALGVGVAAMAVVVHPTGFVALAPLVAALPRLVPLVAGGQPWRERLTRTALVVAPGALASAAAFADGTLHDFLRGQAVFLSIQAQDDWTGEYQRYGFLLASNPMGAYGRRAAVLVGIVLLAWFWLAAAAARGRGDRLPALLTLAGGSLTAAFLLLWLTPSKWTHHFGALAGLGPAFLALFLVALPVLVRQLTGGRRAGPALPVVALGSLAVAAALALHGQNEYAYSWLPGLPNPQEAPHVGPLRFDNPLLWGAVAVVLVLLARRHLRRRGGRGPAWTLAAPLLVLLFLGTSLGYLVGSFGLATVRTLDGYSPWADALTDPLAEDCGAADALRVFDVSAARPVPARTPTPEPGAPFVRGGGWFAPGVPPAEPGTGAATETWGSLPGGGGSEDLTGSTTTPWFDLPAVEGDDVLAVLAAGRLDGGNRLEVQFAADGGAGEPRVVRTQELTDAVGSPVWRTFPLDVAAARADGATALRLVAQDASGGPGGWLAFTGPSVLPLVPLRDYLPADATVAVAWQVSFLFPCQHLPVIRHGITEPPEYGVVWRNGVTGYGITESTWTVPRGGLFAPVQRTSGSTELAAFMPSAPNVRDLQVFRFVVPYPTDGYDLVSTRVTRAGWAGPPV